MMCGIYTPDSGTVHILDADMHSPASFASIRSTIGFCPQQNILYDALSVRDHLRLVARIKGFNHNENNEIDRVCSLIGLSGDEDGAKCAQQLSGGMKRRLCVGMALVGDSRVILLDEPTSGLDPYNRRCLWDIIRKCKRGRTIILTTHYMEEADALADRLALLHHGRVKCCGTPLFLKETFGSGYKLTLTKSDDSNSFDLSKFHSIWNEILNKCNNASSSSSSSSSCFIESHMTHEICIRFANDAAHLLARILTCVDERKCEMGIRNYGVSSSTVEEVFLRLLLFSSNYC